MLDRYINQVNLGDCLTLFRSIPDNSVDVTFADPPFNLRKRYNGNKDNLALGEYLDWSRLWIAEMVRVTKPTGSILVHNIPKWLTHFATILNELAEFKHWIAWDAPTAPMGKTLQPSHYGILFYAKQPKLTKFFEVRYQHKRCRKCGYLQKDYGGKKARLHPFGPLVSDVWTDIHRVKHNKYRDNHPCQLPIHLMERIVLMTTDEGDVILDPFSGTGTTAIAAKRLGRKFIGFELDKTYKVISESKLSQERPDSKIDDIWVSFFLDQVVTIRDIDWQKLSGFYHVPGRIENIDSAPIKPINGKSKSTSLRNTIKTTEN